MRFLDKADFDGLTALLEEQSISTDYVAPLKQLSELKGGQETIASARELLSTMDGVSLEALDDLESTINSIGQLAPSPPSLSVNLTVARGLDYYTGTVFEVHVPELGGEGQVLGGGSYNCFICSGLQTLIHVAVLVLVSIEFYSPWKHRLLLKVEVKLFGRRG